MFLEFNKYSETLAYPDRMAVIRFSKVVDGLTYNVNLSPNFAFANDAPFAFTATTDEITTATAFDTAVNAGFFGADYTSIRIDNVVFIIATTGDLLNGFGTQSEEGNVIDLVYICELGNITFPEIGENCNCLPVQIGDTIKFFIPDTFTESVVEVWLIDSDNNRITMIDSFATTGEIIDPITFGSTLEVGKYRIAMYVEVLSSLVQIYCSTICFDLHHKHLNSYLIRYRNQDNAFGIKWEDTSDWLQFRINLIQLQNQNKSKDVGFKDSSGKLRLLSAITEKEFNFQTDYYNSYIHELLALILRHDEVEILIDRKWITFQCDGDYRIDWVENGVFTLAKAQFKLTQSSHQSWNSYC